MSPEEILALYDREQRREATFPNLRREADAHVVRYVGLPEPHHNFVLYSRLDAANADAVIAEQIAYFDGIGHPFEWKVYGHDTPSDLQQRLAAHGFVDQGPPEAIMVLDLATDPALLHQPVTADVRRLTRPEQLGEMIRVLAQVWPDDPGDWLQEVLGKDLRERPSYTSVYVAYVADEPACCGWIHFPEDSQFASLWGGSTVAAQRQKGLYRSVLATRVQEAQQRGYRFLTIDASPMNRPIAAHYGFQFLTTATAYTWRYEET